MQYIRRLVGGPRDGSQEEIGQHFSTVIGEASLEAGPDNMSVYEYDHSIESAELMERIFVYKPMAPGVHSADYVVKHSRTI